jgi:hypothetical protein
MVRVYPMPLSTGKRNMTEIIKNLIEVRLILVLIIPRIVLKGNIQQAIA